MNRRAAAWIFSASLSIVAPSAVAQRPAMPRIGFLGMDSRMQAERLAAFQDGLRELGYVEGRTIAIEYRWAEGQFDRLPELANQLVALNVDLIVTAAPPSVRAAQRATSRIPIVMLVHDPMGLGFARSLASPGANITGIAFQDSDLSAKRLDLLRQLVPKLTRVAVLWNREGGSPASVKAVEDAARIRALDVVTLEVREVGDFATAIAAAKVSGAQGVLQLASPFITKHRKVLLDLLETHQLPASCELREYVVEGCLMTYSANLQLIFRGLASFVDRILRGANPATLPIEQPREFEFVVNLKTLRSLGLSLPQAVAVQITEPIR